MRTKLLCALTLALVPVAPLPAQQPHAPAPSPFPAPAAAGEPAVLIGAGDIAACDHIEEARKTAAIVEKIPGTVFTLGDNAYDSGTAEQFTACYAPTWGRFKNRTRPAAGDHDYRTAGAGAYFAYFGKAAASRKGYYSYDLGGWHILVVNSNCDEIGGCKKGSAQEQWVREDLAAHPRPARSPCGTTRGSPHRSTGTISPCEPSGTTSTRRARIWSSPGTTTPTSASRRWTPSGMPTRSAACASSWRAPAGARSTSSSTSATLSEVRENQTYGVLKLTLHPDSYDWQFLAAEGTFKDEGSGKCH